jgi:hypothetical protein
MANMRFLNSLYTEKAQVLVNRQSNGITADADSEELSVSVLSLPIGRTNIQKIFTGCTSMVEIHFLHMSSVDGTVYANDCSVQHFI